MEMKPLGVLVVLVLVGSLVIVLTALLAVAPTTAQQFSDWSPPTNLNAIVLSDGTPCPAVVNSAYNDQHPTISKDGLSLIFTSDRPGGSGAQDLWVTERASPDGCWGEPKNLGLIVNSPVNDGAPNLTTDGHWMYFHSRRKEGSCNGGVSAELWVTRRRDARDNFGWEKPINLGCTINMAGFFQNGPTHFEDETGTQSLYFTRLPTGASEDFYAVYVSICSADLATCNTQGLWAPGERVDALNVPPDPLHNFGRTTRTAIRRRDNLEMIISSKRMGGVGTMIELWTSTRATTLDQNWSKPKNLTVLNTSAANTGAPALSWDGTELYFYSNRTDLPGAHTGVNDLYVSKRTKLTTP